jgi:predicted PurR-regulated permease PerM
MGDMQRSRPHWTPRTKLTVVLLLLGFGIFLLYRFRAAISPFILALVLAYVLSPLVGWFEQHLRLRRTLAIALTYLALLIVITILPMVFIPPLTTQATELNLDLQRFLGAIETFLGSSITVAGITINLEAAMRQVTGSIQGIVEPVFGQTIRFAIEAISSLVWVVFILVISFYLLKDSTALHKWMEETVPPTYRDDFVRLRSEINQIWSAFFRGQLLLALTVATIFSVVGFLIGFPFALAMGMLAGLLEFLPSIGHGIWLATASLLALFAGSTWIPVPNWVFTLIIIGIHLFYQQFDLNYLIPRIIGRRVHLPPLVVILGIVTGALLAGVLGIVLAAPTIASARVLGRYVYAYLFDQDPFQATITPALPPPNPRWWRKTSGTENNTEDEKRE